MLEFIKKKVFYSSLIYIIKLFNIFMIFLLFSIPSAAFFLKPHQGESLYSSSLQSLEKLHHGEKKEEFFLLFFWGGDMKNEECY